MINAKWICMDIYLLDKKQWSIDYDYLQITIKTCNKQVVQQQTRINFKDVFSWRLDKWSKILIDI